VTLVGQITNFDRPSYRHLVVIAANVSALYGGGSVSSLGGHDDRFRQKAKLPTEIIPVPTSWRGDGMGLVIFGSGGRAGRRKRKSLHSKLVRPPRRGEGMDDSLTAAARKWKHHHHHHHCGRWRKVLFRRLSFRRSSITVGFRLMQAREKESFRRESFSSGEARNRNSFSTLNSQCILF